MTFAEYAFQHGWTVLEEHVPMDEDPNILRCQWSVTRTNGNRAHCLPAPDAVIRNPAAWPVFLAQAEQGLLSVR